MGIKEIERRTVMKGVCMRQVKNYLNEVGVMSEEVDSRDAVMKNEKSDL